MDKILVKVAFQKGIVEYYDEAGDLAEMAFLFPRMLKNEDRRYFSSKTDIPESDILFILYGGEVRELNCEFELTDILHSTNFKIVKG